MKSTKLVKSIALVLVLMFAFATFAACKDDKGDYKSRAVTDPAILHP